VIRNSELCTALSVKVTAVWSGLKVGCGTAGDREAQKSATWPSSEDKVRVSIAGPAGQCASESEGAQLSADWFCARLLVAPTGPPGRLHITPRQYSAESLSAPRLVRRCGSPSSPAREGPLEALGASVPPTLPESDRPRRLSHLRYDRTGESSPIESRGDSPRDRPQ
jgi:hypothetical protein